MMSIGAFNNSIKEIETLLSRIDLLKSKGVKSISKDGVSSEFKRMSQGNNYFALYKCAISNFDYDILLKDDSIFQFSYDNTNFDIPQIRFAYFQNPQEYKSYDEYLDYLREIGYISFESNEDIGSIFEEDYQQYLTELNINISSTSIRYDVDVPNYRPSIHSVAHIHIGNQTDIRIPCSKILTPVQFILFVIKHIYYVEWKYLIESENIYLNESIESCKASCEDLHNKYWSIQETKELFLS